MIPAKSFAEVRRRFPASPDKVFAAFARADLVELWLTPSPEIRLTVLQFDFREGAVLTASPITFQAQRRSLWLVPTV